MTKGYSFKIIYIYENKNGSTINVQQSICKYINIYHILQYYANSKSRITITNQKATRLLSGKCVKCPPNNLYYEKYISNLTDLKDET